MTESLREYQAWFREQILSAPGNAIVSLPTGTGKTRIAFSVMQSALEKHPSRSVLFIAPTVALVDQQHQAFVDSDVARQCRTVRLGGGKGRFDGPTLEPCAIFATPAAILPFLRFFGMNWLSLVILDECHHSVRRKGSSAKGETEHPYAMIVREYGMHFEARRPKIVGLTASPGDNLEDVEALCRALSARLFFIRVDSELRPCLDKHENKATTRLRNLSSEFKLVGPFVSVLEELSEMARGLRRRMNEDSGEKERTQMRLKEVQDLEDLWRSVGWDSYLETMITDPVKQPPALLERLKALPFRGRSPMLLVLLEELTQAYQKSDGNFRAIVFVTTKRVANALFFALEDVQGTLPWLSPVVLLGANGGEGFTVNKIKTVLEAFRSGERNVLVATSVAEEGIDVPGCNLVVRLEPAISLVRNIQTRGRARFQERDYVILCIDKREADSVDDFIAAETKFNQDLNAYHDMMELNFQCNSNWTESPLGGLGDESQSLETDPSDALFNTSTSSSSLGSSATVTPASLSKHHVLLLDSLRSANLEHEVDVSDSISQVISSASSGYRSSHVSGPSSVSSHPASSMASSSSSKLTGSSSSSSSSSKYPGFVVGGTMSADGNITRGMREMDLHSIVAYPDSEEDERPVLGLRTSARRPVSMLRDESPERTSTSHRTSTAKPPTEVPAFDAGRDWKSVLNLYCQQKFRSNVTVAYRLVESRGPSHNPTFVSGVIVEGVLYEGEPMARKKDSEQSAAYQALFHLAGDRMKYM